MSHLDSFANLCANSNSQISKKSEFVRVYSEQQHQRQCHYNQSKFDVGFV